MQAGSFQVTRVAYRGTHTHAHTQHAHLHSHERNTLPAQFGFKSGSKTDSQCTVSHHTGQRPANERSHILGLEITQLRAAVNIKSSVTPPFAVYLRSASTQLHKPSDEPSRSVSTRSEASSSTRVACCAKQSAQSLYANCTVHNHPDWDTSASKHTAPTDATTTHPQ